MISGGELQKIYGKFYVENQQADDFVDLAEGDQVFFDTNGDGKLSPIGGAPQSEIAEAAYQLRKNYGIMDVNGKRIKELGAYLQLFDEVKASWQARRCISQDALMTQGKAAGVTERELENMAVLLGHATPKKPGSEELDCQPASAQ